MLLRKVTVYFFQPDGNMRGIEESVEQPFLYTGAYYDREAGLYYLRARYYSPELRRFIQRDPILFEGGINLYSYTGCDFVNYGDWEGELFGPPFGPPICKQLGTCGCDNNIAKCKVNIGNIARCLNKLVVERWRQGMACITICSWAIGARGGVQNLNIACAICVTGGVYFVNKCFLPNIKCSYE